MTIDKGLIYSNVETDANKAYVLYVGYVKHMHTTELLIDELSQRYHKPVEVINVIPNLPPPNVGGNYVVVNTRLREHMASKGNKNYLLYLDQPEINEDASDSPYVRDLVKKILQNQPDLFVNLFKNTSEMKLPQQDERVKVIGPDPDITSYLDDKTNQHRIAQELGLPVPESYVASSFEELLRLYHSKFDSGRAFIACANGWAGEGNEIVNNLDDIVNSDKLKGNRFIIKRLLDLEASITTHGIIANEDEILIAGLSDMIMDGVNYHGVVYPSNASKQNIDGMLKSTEKVAKFMGGLGYRGFFNFDFMIDRDGVLYFTEINPRKGGSTPEIILAHHAENPDAVPLPALEFRAVTEGTFGIDISSYRMPDLNWGVKNIKAKEGQVTLNYIPETPKEQEVFRRTGHTIVDHPGKGITFLADNNAGRIVAVARGNGDYDPRLAVLERLRAEEPKIKVA